MRSWGAVILVAALSAGAGLGCSQSSTFQCNDDGSCGPSGTCEANNFCAFPDTTCPSGRRYGDFAEEFAGRCVDADAETEPAGSTSSTSGGSTTSGATTLPLTDGTSGESSTGPVVDETGSSTSGVGEAAVTTNGEQTIGPLAIAENLDDGCMYGTANGGVTWLPSGEANMLGFLGEFPLGRPYYGYFRFELPQALPMGTGVPSATLTLDGHTTYQWNRDAYALAIRIEVSEDAAQVQGEERFPANGQTQLYEEFVRWPEAGGLVWDVDGTNVSTDVGPLIEALLQDVGGLEAGAHVQFWISKAELVQDAEVGYVDFTANPNRAATLTLTVNGQ